MSPIPELTERPRLLRVATAELAISEDPTSSRVPMPVPRPFASHFLSLPTELQTQILLFLSPDELCALSAVPQLSGIEDDKYLKAVWIQKVGTATPLRSREDGCRVPHRHE